MLSLSTAPARIASRDTFALTQVPSAVTTPAVMGTQRRHVSRRQVTPVCMGRKAAKVAKKKAGSIVKGCQAGEAKRTKLYGKYGKLIVTAVKQGGGPDPVSNVQLGKVLAEASRLSVPKELIDRNIKRASDTKQADFMELTYEAYGHGGVGIIMEVLTDNVNRAVAETRAIVNKGGGKMAESGSVLFNFERKGIIVLDCPGDKEDEVFEVAADAGGDDIVPRDDGEEGFTVVTEVSEFMACQRALADAGFTVNADETALKMIPLAAVEVDDDLADLNDALVEKLLENEDVDAVYTQ